MSKEDKPEGNLSEQEIDQIIIGQADDETAWDEPIRVQRDTPTDLSIPANLAARAAFLAQLHRTGSLEEWVARVVQERVELEEAAFREVKQALATRAG